MTVFDYQRPETHIIDKIDIDVKIAQCYKQRMSLQTSSNWGGGGGGGGGQTTLCALRRI